MADSSQQASRNVTNTQNHYPFLIPLKTPLRHLYLLPLVCREFQNFPGKGWVGAKSDFAILYLVFPNFFKFSNSTGWSPEEGRMPPHPSLLMPLLNSFFAEAFLTMCQWLLTRVLLKTRMQVYLTDACIVTPLWSNSFTSAPVMHTCDSNWCHVRFLLLPEILERTCLSTSFNLYLL